MSRRIPPNKREKITEMYSQGTPMKRIAEKVGVSYGTVYNLTRLRERTNPHTGKPYHSPHEASVAGVSSRFNKEEIRFYRSHRDYLDGRLQEWTNPETGEHFESMTDYLRFREKERSKRPENRQFAEWLSEQLHERGKTAWLAEQVGISRQALYQYKNGKCLPSYDILEKINGVLGPAKPLEQLLEKYRGESNSHE
ncbi:MAG: helix-turn-helix transcriptional regulator [Candidatus Woesearchaeota archaeon]